MMDQQPDIRVVLVTPDMARRWLQNTVDNNRLIRGHTASGYARAMMNDNWLLAPDAMIMLTKDGQLLNGQHRCTAIILANKPVLMYVAFGVDPAVMTVLDTGLKRGFADAARVEGIPNGSNNGAIVKRIWQWEDGNFAAITGKGGRNPSNSEVLERYAKDADGFNTATAWGGAINRARVGAPTAAGTAYFLFAALDPEQATQVFESYRSGANLSQGDPILALRNRMAKKDLNVSKQLIAIIKTWNSWREGRRVFKLNVSAGRLTNADFPQPK